MIITGAPDMFGVAVCELSTRNGRTLNLLQSFLMNEEENPDFVERQSELT